MHLIFGQIRCVMSWVHHTDYPRSALNQSGSPLLIAHSFILSMAVGGFFIIIFQPKLSYICPIILLESDGSKNCEN